MWEAVYKLTRCLCLQHIEIAKKETVQNNLKFKQEVKLMAFSRIVCLELGTDTVPCCFGLVMHFRYSQ